MIYMFDSDGICIQQALTGRSVRYAYTVHDARFALLQLVYIFEM